MNGVELVAIKNILKRPVRSIALLFLAAILALSVFSGTVAVRALQNGFSSLEKRLGADIMVVPYEATTKSKFEDMVLQGSTGYFYMNGEYLDEISQIDGIGQISPQYYLATVKAGCCSIPVQIIGYDPKTDFSITPWIKKSSGAEIGYLDVVAGNDLNAFVGDELSFFGVKVNVAAKLDKTGTSYDTQIFTTKETIQTLIDASLNKQLNEYANINSGNVVSCILIDVADGYVVEDVLNDINVHYKKLKAIRTANMISGISDSLAAVSDIARILAAVLWFAALGIMVVAFAMMNGERKKEFAVLRAMGASRKILSKIVFIEGVGISLAGSLLGTAVGVFVILPFSGYIETKLSLPFLLPKAGFLILAALLSVVLSTAAGAVSSQVAASRVSRIDTGTILRSGE